MKKIIRKMVSHHVKYLGGESEHSIIEQFCQQMRLFLALFITKIDLNDSWKTQQHSVNCFNF